MKKFCNQRIRETALHIIQTFTSIQSCCDFTIPSSTDCHNVEKKQRFWNHAMSILLHHGEPCIETSQGGCRKGFHERVRDGKLEFYSHNGDTGDGLHPFMVFLVVGGGIRGRTGYSEWGLGVNRTLEVQGSLGNSFWEEMSIWEFHGFLKFWNSNMLYKVQ